jgi:hypothetical protein
MAFRATGEVGFIREVIRIEFLLTGFMYNIFFVGRSPIQNHYLPRDTEPIAWNRNNPLYEDCGAILRRQEEHHFASFWSLERKHQSQNAVAWEQRAFH